MYIYVYDIYDDPLSQEIPALELSVFIRVRTSLRTNVKMEIT